MSFPALHRNIFVFLPNRFKNYTTILTRTIIPQEIKD